MKIENQFAVREKQFNEIFNKSISGNVVDKGSENYNFGSVLKDCVDKVNDMSIISNNATNSFVRGDENTSIDDVMMKATEAGLSLQFLTTTRDKLVEGYKELIKTSV